MSKKTLVVLFCLNILVNIVSAKELSQVAEAPVGKYFYVNSYESENNINQLEVDILFVPNKKEIGSPDHTIFKYVINLTEGTSVCTTRQDYNEKKQLYQEHYYGKLIVVPVKDVDCLVNSLKIIAQQPLQTEERFRISEATEGLEYVTEWLKSFRALTITTENSLAKSEKEKIGNLGADVQTLGFYNWPKTIEGTLLKQEYEISYLEYQLALERKANGKTNLADVQEKEEKYLLLKIKMLNFLRKFHIAD